MTPISAYTAGDDNASLDGCGSPQDTHKSAAVKKPAAIGHRAIVWHKPQFPAWCDALPRRHFAWRKQDQWPEATRSSPAVAQEADGKADTECGKNSSHWISRNLFLKLASGDRSRVHRIVAERCCVLIYLMTGCTPTDCPVGGIAHLRLGLAALWRQALLRSRTASRSRREGVQVLDDVILILKWVSCHFVLLILYWDFQITIALSRASTLRMKEAIAEGGS
jgi:hypothetical protein